MTKKIIVETSARHAHLCEEDLAILFGEGHKLTKVKDLSQPGQYACEERVTVVGPKNEIKNVIILGPTRPSTQVEISLTDARGAGLSAQVRESGDIEGTTGCKLIGPKGEVTLTKGVIAAKRHIHFTEEDATEFGVEDKQIVSVEVLTPNRTTTFGDVVCRVNKSFATYMHIDTDEANASGISGNVEGIVIK